MVNRSVSLINGHIDEVDEVEVNEINDGTESQGGEDNVDGQRDN